ncbi:hypothetical protein F4677DRAFT_402124 [Hypoxylon crocopeplum]|nr:hypothetical protein F4677DRAFT_402124 [Hypoxylon crocopeplum]
MSGKIMQRLHRSTLVCCAILVLIVWYYLFPNDRTYSPLSGFFAEDRGLEFLDRATRKLSFELSPSVIYSRRCIEPIFASEAKRQEVVNVSVPLIEDQVTLRLDQLDTSRKALTRCTPIKLTVPKPHPTGEKFPHIIFGLATTYKRLRESLMSIAHWCSDRDLKLIAIVEDWNDRAEDVSKLQQEYRDNGIQASFVEPLDGSHTTSQSHFMVLTLMATESGPETKWFGLLDDDTFFPHLKPLSDALGQLDHTADMYVGALAEDFGSVKNFGIMAYGGAGAYLSAALAKKLGVPDQAEACIRETPPNLGDIILRDCVYQHSQARLTILPRLYQHDLIGDMSGFFESGVEPINLHHWKSWYHEPVVEMATAATFCGNCFLQRWRFTDDTILSNGYSIATYRYGLEKVDLGKMEQTWSQVYGDINPEYSFALGPLREKMGDDEKKSYKLADSEISAHGVMRQLYVRKGDFEAGELDEVVELEWQTRN